MGVADREREIGEGEEWSEKYKEWRVKARKNEWSRKERNNKGVYVCVLCAS